MRLVEGVESSECVEFVGRDASSELTCETSATTTSSTLLDTMIQLHRHRSAKVVLFLKPLSSRCGLSAGLVQPRPEFGDDVTCASMDNLNSWRPHWRQSEKYSRFTSNTSRQVQVLRIVTPILIIPLLQHVSQSHPVCLVNDANTAAGLTESSKRRDTVNSNSHQ